MMLAFQQYNTGYTVTIFLLYPIRILHYSGESIRTRFIENNLLQNVRQMNIQCSFALYSLQICLIDMV